MPYNRSRLWRRRDPLCPLDQVGNAPDSIADLTPVSEVPAQHVKDGWDPWRQGQAVPLFYERVDPIPYDPEECEWPWRTR